MRPCTTLGDLRIRFTFDRAIEFRDALAFVQPCISNEETRYYLNGAYLHPADGVLKITATDGHRLGLRALDANWPDADQQPGVIMPAAAVKALLDTFGKKPTGQADVAIYSSDIIVSSGKWVLRTKIIDGSFPDYTRVIPQEHDASADIDKDVLENSIKRLTAMIDRGGQTCAIDTSDNIIAVRDTDHNTHNMPLGLMAGQGETRIGVNISYLGQSLGVFAAQGAEAITMRFGKPGNPMTMRSPQTDGLHVIMPVRI